MLSQNTQDSIQQSLFTTTGVRLQQPTITSQTFTRPATKQIVMSVAKPSLSGNFKGTQMVSGSSISSVQRFDNNKLSMSMQ